MKGFLDRLVNVLREWVEMDEEGKEQPNHGQSSPPPNAGVRIESSSHIHSNQHIPTSSSTAGGTLVNTNAATFLLRPCLLTIYGTAIVNINELRDNDILYLSLDGPKRLPHKHTVMMLLSCMGAKMDVNGMMGPQSDRMRQWYDEDEDECDDEYEEEELLEESDQVGLMRYAALGSSTQCSHQPSIRASRMGGNGKHSRHVAASRGRSNGGSAGSNSVAASVRAVGDAAGSHHHHAHHHHHQHGAHGPLSALHCHPIRILPTDLFVSILTFMSHDELLEASLVCQSWYKVIMDDDVVWRELCANVYYEREREKRRRRALEKGGNSGSLQPNVCTTAPVSQQTDATTTATVGPSNSASANGTPSDVADSTLAGGPAGASSQLGGPLEIPLDQIREIFHNRKRPPIYKRWKTYYRYYILFAGMISWDTTQCGPSIKFKNNNRTVHREDNVSYHWQTVRGSRAISIPTEEEQKKNGIYNPNNVDDMAIYEWEIEVNRFDKTNQNGWWIVISVATEEFGWRSSSPSSLVGYDNSNGFGYATNGDCLHCYSNPSLKFKQKYTCQPIQPFVPKSFGEGDVVKVRLQFCNKLYRDLLDPKMWVGATLEFFVNGTYVGQAFRNIEGKVFPAVSVLTNQCVTLRAVDPIADEWRKVVRG
eukprot:CAMPEP_0117443168 /NCGR_PEP_ID=MMETSP0759-20121206/4552_1 /TAXON_ID=63605 /ORGANISM="Percolomonas cosmopolitus, Strain WS" /LENGTH=649 /DNA_ID=CAMNT_0005235127 /DNA_START=400 /DNA_END=2349 /DNA_ORIENTATION=+